MRRPGHARGRAITAAITIVGAAAAAGTLTVTAATAAGAATAPAATVRPATGARSAASSAAGPVVNPVTYTAPTGAGLDNPMGVAADGAGDVDVSDTAENVVARLAGGTTTIVAGSYEATGYAGDGGPGADASLASPTGLAWGHHGELFIADTANDVVREVRPDGTITTVAGDGREGDSGDGGPATRARLDNPQGVAVSPAGDLYIADTDNDVVREVRPDGTITTVAGTGRPGYRGDGGPATLARLSAPTDVALDAAGDLYIADAGNNVIRRVSTRGIITTAAGDVAADAADGGLGGFSGDGGPATAARLHTPEGIALDRAGDLFIADTFNNAVREVSPSGTITTLVNTAGTKGSIKAATDVPAGSAPLDSPYAVAVDDRTGDVYVADTTNNAIRQVSGLPVPGSAHAGPPGVVGTAGRPAAAGVAPVAAALPAAVAAAGGSALFARRRNRRVRPAVA